MAITRAEAQEQILEALGSATEQIGLAVECLGEAYEQLSESEGDRLEMELFGPAQKAFGLARRTRDGFSSRTGTRAAALLQLPVGARSQGARAFIDKATQAAEIADHEVAELQDTMLPIEAGDPELRAGLAAVREQLAAIPAASRDFVRTLGR